MEPCLSRCDTEGRGGASKFKFLENHTHTHTHTHLSQDAFHVWESAGRTRDFFSRGKERHVFLFEKVIIISKKIEVTVQRRNKKSDTYIYKHHLQVFVLETKDYIQQLCISGPEVLAALQRPCFNGF